MASIAINGQILTINRNGNGNGNRNGYTMSLDAQNQGCRELRVLNITRGQCRKIFELATACKLADGKEVKGYSLGYRWLRKGLGMACDGKDFRLTFIGSSKDGSGDLDFTVPNAKLWGLHGLLPTKAVTTKPRENLILPVSSVIYLEVP